MYAPWSEKGFRCNAIIQFSFQSIRETLHVLSTYYCTRTRRKWRKWCPIETVACRAVKPFYAVCLSGVTSEALSVQAFKWAIDVARTRDRIVDVVKRFAKNLSIETNKFWSSVVLSLRIIIICIIFMDARMRLKCEIIIGHGKIFGLNYATDPDLWPVRHANKFNKSHSKLWHCTHSTQTKYPPNPRYMFDNIEFSVRYGLQ